MATYTDPYPLRMPRHLRPWLEAIGAEKERSVNWVICHILQDAYARSGWAERLHPSLCQVAAEANEE